MKSKRLTFENLSTMPIKKLVTRLSIPPMISMTLTGFYATVDTIFIASVGKDALIALSLSLPVTALIIAFAVGTANGASSLISRSFGKNDVALANELAKTGLLLALMSALLFALCGLLFTKVFLAMFTTNKHIILLASYYIKISTLFSFGFFIEVTCSRYLQAIGNTSIPMIAQLVGAIINIIFDPLLIFGLLFFPKLGLAGAAIANIIGQLAGMIVSVLSLLLIKSEFNLSFKNFRLKWALVKHIYHMALPNIAMLALTSIAVSVMNRIAASFSTITVALLGVIYKIQNQIEYPIIGLSQAILQILSFNFGAQKKERLIQAYKFSLIMTFFISLFFTLTIITFPKAVLTIFNSAHVSGAVLALSLVAFSFLFNGLNFITIILFQAIGHVHHSFWSSFSKQIILLCSLALIFTTLFGEVGLWLAYPASEILNLIIFLPLSFKTLNLVFNH